MSILNTFSTIIGLVDKALGLMPDYDQKLVKKWVKLKEEYNKQINLELKYRDADYILNLKDAILLYARDVIGKEKK